MALANAANYLARGAACRVLEVRTMRSAALVSCVVAACGGGRVTVNVKSLSDGVAARVEPAAAGTGEFGAAPIGPAGLTSYRLYIMQIQFCESLTIADTGYSNPQNCSVIYRNEQDDYMKFDVAAAAAASSGKYVDILSAADRAKLTSSATIGAGKYNFGIIDWYRPVEVTGQVTLANGATIYTKTCPTSGACAATAMDTAPAEPSIYDSDNGGTWMRFLEPFEVANGDSIDVDLAFDLDERLFGGSNVSNGQITQAMGCSAVASGYCGLYSPILRLMPAPRRAGTSTMAETYEMTSTASDQWKLRVDLYYNSSDPAGILAADVFAIPTATTASEVGGTGVGVSDVSVTGGVTTLLDPYGTTLTDFTRGDSGTATLSCPSGVTLPGCPAGGTLGVAWSARTVRTL
jgi:hypothetical protein